MKLLTIGIDLGNTNSAACYYDGAHERLIENAQGQRHTPSAVSQENGEFVVGRPALTQARRNPFTYQRWKRYLGTNFKAEELSELPLVEGPEGKAWISGEGGETFPPERLSSVMLSNFLDVAEMRLGKRPNGLVITVPAAYLDQSRKAVIRASIDAGINRVSLLAEPVSAALAYGLHKSKMETVLVYDLGGSTFDVSIMMVGGKDGKFRHETLATLSDNSLGGMNFDKKIVERVLKGFAEREGVDLANIPRALPRVNDACEQAKIDLSTQEVAEINVSMVARTDKGFLSIEDEITRDVFEEDTKHLVDRTIDVCRDALTAAGKQKEEIDTIILVGGQTLMPSISKAVENFFGKKPLAQVNPFEVVAIGASIKAAQEDGRAMTTLNDRTSMSVGIRASTGAFMPIIPRGSSYGDGIARTITLTSMQDNQSSIKLQVYQGNAAMALDNELVQELDFPVDQAIAGEPSVNVKIAVDENNIVSVGMGD